MSALWPMLKPARARELRNALPEPRNLHVVANNITVYPGGGVPAHKLREAARLLAEVVDWLDEETAA